MYCRVCYVFGLRPERKNRVELSNSSGPFPRNPEVMDPDFNGRCRVRLDDGGDEKLVKRQNVGLLLGPAIAEFF